jgi:hypothetical protein
VRLDNALVDIGRKAEIIRVDDEPFSRNQNKPSLIRRNFLGFARISLARL